jgi:mannose-6-phosphate isomerase
MPCDHGLPPLTFYPIYKEKIWGGRAFERKLNKNIPFGRNIGESWELSAMPGNESRVHGGPHDGESLTSIFEREKKRLVGLRDFPFFPLLYKFIDPNENLSVQVHPGDQPAGAGKPAIFGKTECWFVVDAKPGAQLICGFREGVHVQDVKDAVEEGRVPEVCNYMPIGPGDVVLVPAGTVHALIEGVLIYEVQQTSDTTYRLYDWGRMGASGVSRPLHVREALEALDIGYHDRHKIVPVVCTSEDGIFHSVRAVCRYFALEEYRLGTSCPMVLGAKNSFQVVTVLDGELTCPGADGRTILVKGQTALLPACAAPLDISAEASAHFLVSYVPDIERDIVDPLLKRGASREAIVGLGGNSERNDVMAAWAPTKIPWPVI